MSAFVNTYVSAVNISLYSAIDIAVAGAVEIALQGVVHGIPNIGLKVDYPV
jgi:hypothetical protein